MPDGPPDVGPTQVGWPRRAPCILQRSMMQLVKSRSVKEHTPNWILPLLQTCFHHVEDFPTDKRNRAARLIKSFLEQTLIKENCILAEPFKIQTACSWFGELDSAALRQALRRQSQGALCSHKGNGDFTLCSKKLLLSQWHCCAVAALCQSRATDLP